MARRLTGSIFRQLSTGLFLVATVLTVVIWLTQSLRFVDMIINHGATAGTFVQLTILLIPSFLTIVLPVALFMTIVFIYSRMTSDRELVIMSASGLSPLQLAKPVLILCGIVMFLTYAINLFFMPESYRMFGELKWHMRYSLSQIVLEDGKFNSLGDKATVYIRERTSNNELKGIFYHDERDPGAPFTLMAKRGSLIKTDDGAQIVMFEGNRQALDAATKNYSVLYFDRYALPLENYNEEKTYRTPDSRELTVLELFDVESNANIPERDYPKFIVEGHKRLISPLVSLAFALIAVVCLFSGGFTRRNQNRRVIVATCTMLILQITILGVENVSARNLVFVPVMYGVIIVPVVIGIVMLLRPPRLDILG